MSNEEIRAFLHDTCCPVGHQYTLVIISVTKRWLKEEMPASYRLEFLTLDVYAEHCETFAGLNPSLIAALKQSPSYRASRRTVEV
jgi:hypothetical protein